ncbi:MAG TPA: hypothetical protein VK200_01400 [Candidatus Limnocylindrales bacterium]|nr:hypothetical protein [Candidatus Limnocylindrales bacterium]
MAPAIKKLAAQCLIFYLDKAMSYQIKLLSLPAVGNYVITFGRGVLRTQELERLLVEVTRAAQSLADCKVLIDVQDATLQISPMDLGKLLTEMQIDSWLGDNKIAVLAKPPVEQHNLLKWLTRSLSIMQVNIALFDQLETALRWLTEA